uniref:Pregnancy up-regulated nonubiquitous CaM kinase n=1 Tax=Salmo trutta TaxID=8032 RepID=A0A674EVL4_SALTR
MWGCFRGSISEVRVAQHCRTLRLVAVKCIGKRVLKGKEGMLENEIAALRRIIHPNMVMEENFETSSKLYFVMTLSGFWTVFWRGGATQRDASRVLLQVLEAPENLLYQTLSIDSKIVSDFACGPPAYLLQQKSYDKEVDLWALGCSRLCGCPLFNDHNDSHMYMLIIKAEYEFDSKSAIDFIPRMLQKEPEIRYNCEQNNIHESVSEQIQKNFAKSKWKVRHSMLSEKNVAVEEEANIQTKATLQGEGRMA